MCVCVCIYMSYPGVCMNVLVIIVLAILKYASNATSIYTYLICCEWVNSK